MTSRSTSFYWTLPTSDSDSASMGGVRRSRDSTGASICATRSRRDGTWRRQLNYTSSTWGRSPTRSPTLDCRTRGARRSCCNRTQVLYKGDQEEWFLHVGKRMQIGAGEGLHVGSPFVVDA